jgi:hypothetical protein
MAGYDRDKAVDYAAKFWDKVCHDGYVAVLGEAKPGKSRPTRIINVPVGTKLIGWTAPQGFSEDDCTHFISCCIGLHGGGLSLGHHDFPPAYGSLSPRSLIKVLGGKLKPLVKDVNTSPPGIETEWIEGDLVAFGNSAGDNYQHIALHIGASLVTCHSYSRFADDLSGVSIRPMTFLHIV